MPANVSKGCDRLAGREAATLYGTTTKKDTVNTALREAALSLRRVQAWERLGELGRAGDFDELLDKRRYRQ